MIEALLYAVFLLAGVFLVLAYKVVVEFLSNKIRRKIESIIREETKDTREILKDVRKDLYSDYNPNSSFGDLIHFWDGEHKVKYKTKLDAYIESLKKRGKK